MLIATYVVIRRIPYLYESRSLIAVATPGRSGDESFSASIKYDAVLRQLKSRGSLATLVRRHKLYPQLKDLDSALSRLENDIKLDVKMREYQPEGPESILIRYRYNDPAIAQKVVADLITNFEQANTLIRQEAANETNRINAKIIEAEAQLKKIGPKNNLALLREQMASRSDSVSVALSAQRLTIESAVGSLSDREYTLERQIDDLQRQITEMEKTIAEANARGGNKPVDNPAYGTLLVRKSEIEAQINVYAKQYTEKNPKLIDARAQLAEINREIARLESGNNFVSKSPLDVAQLRNMRQQLKQLETELEVTRRDLNRKSQSLDKMPANLGRDITATATDANATAEYSLARTEYDRLLARYNWLLDKRDALMRLADFTGSGASMFQVIDTPFLPTFPTAPNPLLLQGLALGLALVFGLLAVFALELPRMFLLNDERDVEYFLGVPVVALIPETLTRIEQRRNRRLRWTRGMILLLLIVGLIPVLVVLLDRAQIFQILGKR